MARVDANSTIQGEGDFSGEATVPYLIGMGQTRRRQLRWPSQGGGSTLLRMLNRFLCRTWPALAAQVGHAQLGRPPQSRYRDWQTALLATAQVRQLRFRRDERLTVYEWGDGPTVLLVHNWGGNGMALGKMVGPLVDAGFRVVSFDAHGHSGSTGDHTDMILFAASISAVAADAGPLHAVVGHSFGAAVAMLAWRDWWVRAKKMVLISPLENCSWLMEAFGQSMGVSAQVLVRICDKLSRLHGGRLDWTRMSVIDMVRESDFPILIVHDEDDEEVPVDYALAMAGASRQAKFKGARGSGHHAIVRDSQVASLTARFLAE